MHTTHLRLAALAALAAVALAACSSSSKASSTTNPPAAAPTTTVAAASTTTAAAAGAPKASNDTISIASSKFGNILVDSKGMTVYVDEKDKPGAPNCTGACLKAWPPVVAPGTANFGTGLSGSNFSSITLSDGTKQLTVAGSPLYTWQGDAKPGDVTGQDVNGFYVVMPNGKKYDPS